MKGIRVGEVCVVRGMCAAPQLLNGAQRESKSEMRKRKGKERGGGKTRMKEISRLGSNRLFALGSG